MLLVVVPGALMVAGSQMFRPAASEEGLKLLLSTVTRGPYDFVITEQGTVENAANVEIKCEVRSRYGGSVTIINVVDEGTHVEAGDVVVELDSSALEQEKVTQLIDVTGQKALLVQAENRLAAAQIAREEYESGTFVEEEKLLIANQYVAQQALSTAETGLDQARQLFARAIVTARQVESADFAVEDARNRLSAADTKLENLRRYTREKMLKTFDSNIATATADVAAQQNRFSLEERRLRDIEDQIAKCTLRAPGAGEVVYANEYNSNWGNMETNFVVAPGAMVRERQTIIRLPNSDEMQVRATVNQARVNLVRPQMPVTIRVDALKDDVIRGEVTKVNPYADPSGWSGGNIKRYATFIKLDDPPAGLKAGMIAEVRIQVEHQPSALQVPVQALAQHQGRFFCLVKGGDDYETREVRLSSTNDRVAAIEEGLAEGEVVVLNPRRAGELLQLPEQPDTGPAQVVNRPHMPMERDAGATSGRPLEPLETLKSSSPCKPIAPARDSKLR
jgi:multidrug efflux pump subunit AcrA (membrane-fusion protein)